MYKVLKGTGIALSSLALGLYVSPYFFKGTINEGIKEVANNYVKTEVEFQNIDISFFKHFPKLTVTLENSSIKASNPFKNENLIDAKEIALGVDVKSLFADKIIFNELYINQANINLKIDSLGRNNYDIIFPSEEVEKDNESGVGLSLNDIKINESNFIYNDQSTKVVLDLKGFNYDGFLDFKDNIITIDADTDIKNSLFKLDKDTYVKNLPLKGKIKSTIDLNTLSFDFTDNQLVLGQFPFSLKGSLKMPNENKVFDLNISSEKNDLKTIPAVIPEAYQEWAKDIEMKGVSSILFTMKGIMNSEMNQNPDIHIEAKIEDGSLNYKQSKTPIERLNLTSSIDLPALNPDKLRVKVDQLDFKLLNGLTKSKFTYWAGASMFTEGEIVSNIDLEALKNATGFKQIDTKGVLELEGNWKGSIVTNSKNSLIKVPTFYMKSNLNNGYFKMAEMPAAIDHINFDLEVSNKDGNYENTSVLIHQIDAKALDNFIEGKLKISNLKNFPIDADFKAKMHLQDIYKIYPLTGIDLRGDLFAQMKAKGTYEPNRKKVPVSKSVFVLKNGYLRFEDLPNLPLENISIETHLKSGRGSFSDLSVKILPISFSLAGKPFTINADLKNFNNLDYRVHSKGQIKLGDIYKLFPIEGLDVDGMITANLGLKGNNGAALNNLQNRGFVKLENITINTKYFPSKFKIKEGDFKFNGNQLTFENVKARYKRNQFIFDGNVSNYINYALKENETLKGNINFKTSKVNINDFMLFSGDETSSSSASNEGVVMLPKDVELNINGKAKKVLFNDLVLDNFNGNLNLNKGNLSLNTTQFNMIGSTFNMNGTYRSINGRNAKFSFDIDANNFDIQRAYKEITLFRELASAAENAHGKVSMNYHLEGYLGADMFPRLKTVKGGGDIMVEDVQFMGFKVFNTVAAKTSTDALHDAKLKNVKVKTKIDNNVLTIERTKFKVAGFRPRIEGQVTLDGYMNIGMRLGLPPFGIIGIPIKITGPADTFEVEVGKYEREELFETDEEYSEFQKTIEEEKAKELLSQQK